MLGLRGASRGSRPQTTELTRGPPELVQHFRYRRSSHRRKSAACPKFYIVWPNFSPNPVGRRGDNFLVQMLFYLSSLQVEEEERESAPCGLDSGLYQPQVLDPGFISLDHRFPLLSQMYQNFESMGGS